MRYLDHGRQLCYKAGQAIFGVGAPSEPDSVFYILEGRVRLRHGFEDSHELVRTVEKDGMFGLVSAFAHNNRIFDAVAEEDSLVYCWDLPGFERAISVYIELAAMAVQELSTVMRQVNNELEHLS